MMPHRVLGVLFFTMMGAAIGYVLATAYLDWRLSMPVGYDFLVLQAKSLWATQPDLAEHAAFIVGGPALAAAMLGAFLITEKLSTFGTTHWQTPAEMKSGGFHEQLGTGFLLAKTGSAQGRGRFVCSHRFPHCMVIAPTGRGKGVGFVIPNLLTFKGSTVVLDVKGENFEKTARRRQEMGDDVIRFSPTDFAANSHRYNPLKRISEIENSAQQMFELSKLATLFLVADNPHNEGLLRGGMNAFVAGAILAFERGRPTLGEVYRIINGGDGDYASTFRSYAQETQNPQAAVLWSSLAKVVDKTLSGYISMVNTGGLDPWKNSHIDAMTAVSDFSFEDLRRNPQSIYLTIRDQDIAANAGLIRLFFSDLIATLQHHEPGPQEPWPVMLILDEFHRLGKMPIVADSITTLRSFGGHLAVITQTIPKLDEIYGRNERLSLEGGAGIKLYMTPSEELTVENLSAACGSTTKRVVSKSKGIGPFATPTVSERSEERPLLTEDDARRLPLDDVILVVDGGMPIRAKRIKYYADRTLGPIFRAQSGDLPEPEPHLPLTKSEDAAPAMVKDTEKASPQPDLMKSLEEISAKITALETKVAAAGSAQDASPDASNDAANRLERPYSELLAALELAETKIAVLENKVNQAIHDTATTSSEVAAETSPDLPGSGLQKRRKNRGLYVENTRATSIVNSMASSTG